MFLVCTKYILNFNPSKKLSDDEKKKLKIRLEEFFNSCIPYSTFEKRVLKFKKWHFNLDTPTPNFNQENGPYFIQFNDDFSVVITKKGNEYTDDTTYYGYWDLWWNDKIFKFYFLNQDKIPFVKAFSEIYDEQRAEWSIKSVKP